MSEHHFENTLPDFDPDKQSPFLNETNTEISEEFKKKIKDYCDPRLQELLKRKREIFEDGSVYTGSGGIALLLYNLAKKKEKEEGGDQTAAYQDILQYVDMDNVDLRETITFLCGVTGPIAIRMALKEKLGTRPDREETVMISLSTFTMDLSEISDEYLYGRAGFLYTLLFLRKELPTDIYSYIIKDVALDILKTGDKLTRRVGMRKEVPVLYRWHKQYYMGAAHGMAGILYALLLADCLPEEELNITLTALDWVLARKYPSGNLPASLGKKPDRLVQWCHGAPGLVQPLCLAYKITSKQHYLDGAIGCGDVTWERGLCTKGFSLCHGVSGNAYAFLQLYQTTGNALWLHRACSFAQWCMDEKSSAELYKPDRPVSLYEGMAGRLYFLYDLLDPKEAVFPGYSL